VSGLDPRGIPLVACIHGVKTASQRGIGHAVMVGQAKSSGYGECLAASLVWEL
jgi:hypothetical protein